MNVFGIIKLKDVLTFLNLSSGLLAIFFAIKSQFIVASILLFVAVIFDYSDGKVARKRNIPSQFGKELDSLADVVSFGVAPAVLVYSFIGNIYFSIFYIIFVVAGVLRLARYNLTEGKGYFEGMPITCNGIIFPILILLKLSSVYLYIALVIAAFLMVSKVKVPRIP